MTRQQDDLHDLNWDMIGAGTGDTFYGTAGDDNLVGTRENDSFYIGQGGNDQVHGGSDNDVIFAGASLTSEDRINGGSGVDVLVLQGDYSAGLVLQPDTVNHIEDIQLEGHHNYDLTLDRGGHVAPNFHLSIIASVASQLTINAVLATLPLNVEGTQYDDIVTGGKGNDEIAGDKGDDILSGGKGDDYLWGGEGVDTLTGGAGNDQFDFRDKSSLPSHPDTITDFSHGDTIVLAGIDADPNTPGEQHFHFGTTPDHVGDVTDRYDAHAKVTYVDLFTNDTGKPSQVIKLGGNHSDLNAADFLFSYSSSTGAPQASDAHLHLLLTDLSAGAHHLAIA